MVEHSSETIEAGEDYFVWAYDFHRTEPGGDGRVATILTKHGEGKHGAMSSCRIGIEPDTDFDRFQLSPAQLWTYVFEVLGANSQVVGSIEHQAQENSSQLEVLRKVEQMAAYYEAPQGFFDWLDLQVTLHGGTPTAPDRAGSRIEVTPANAPEASQ